MNKEFFKNKRVLITGHTDFKESWLTLLLSELGAEIMEISLDPKISKDFYVVDYLHNLCDSHICGIGYFNTIHKIISGFQRDVVFHLAAQSLVRYSYMNPLETYQTNVMEKVNLLESTKNIKSKCSVVVIATDKVYENKEWNIPTWRMLD